MSPVTANGLLRSHPKNFLIGDEWGHFTCTVCTIKRQRALTQELLKALKIVAQYANGDFAHGIAKAAIAHARQMEGK